jgi:response regulator RpfG family c-di-GMP phosphodiesterase
MSQTVLVLDDESDNVHLICESLRRQLPGVCAIGFSAPQEAVAWCATHEPDLCLVDYRMPVMSGVEFVRRLRAQDHLQGVPVIMITAQTAPALQQEALDAGATDFLSKPINVPDVLRRVRNHLRLRTSLRSRHADLGSLERSIQEAAQRLVEQEQALIIQRLTRASGYRDGETGNHMRRMAAIARLVAEELGLGCQFADALFVAAPLHDIGKVGIPDRVLLKPGKLDAAEWGLMKTHTTIGYELLRDSGTEMLRLGGEIAHTHHERWNGQGYPNGLAGEAIPLSGRIVAVADVFDALVNVRHYKPAWALGDAIELMRRERGEHFDPNCVNALLRRIDDVIDIQKQYAEPPAPAVSGAAVG